LHEISYKSKISRRGLSSKDNSLAIVLTVPFSSVLESPQVKSPEKEREDFYTEYKELLEKDTILQMIYESMNDSWDKLNEAEKHQLLNLFKNLIKSLREYYNTYINLQRASKRKLYFEDIKKFQEAVKNADTRERIAHNAFIDSLNILSRKMKVLGLDNSWRKNEKIYGITKYETIEKTRNWMLSVMG